MKILLFVFALTTGVFARPDVSSLSGYNYNSQVSGQSFGTPTGSYLPGNTNFGGNFGTSGTNVYNQGNVGNGFAGQGGMVQDQKNVYFFAAADEEEQSRLRINVVPASHKNAKIIFIKAPSYGSPIPEVIAPPSQSEDKTVVYVLVKKSDQVKPINIPASASVNQAKPEVYFIKYGTKQEAEQALSSGLNGQAVGSGVQDLNNQQAFIATIKDSVGGDQGLGGGDGILGGNAQGSFGGSSVISSGSGSTQGFGDGGAGVSSNYGPPSGSGPY